jgi:broad specificity phosphatase PhoE
MAAMRILLFMSLLLALPAWADEGLWNLLEKGGQVILIRHTITEPGTGDPPGFRLDDCATQRNLSDAGRAHARRIGEAFRQRQVPVARVLSSPWCRCVETAKLAFGKAETSTPLSNLFGRPENRERQVREMKRLIVKPAENLVLVSHGSTIAALTDVYLGTGEMVIVTPRGKGAFAVRGRLLLE